VRTNLLQRQRKGRKQIYSESRAYTQLRPRPDARAFRYPQI